MKNWLSTFLANLKNSNNGPILSTRFSSQFLGANVDTRPIEEKQKDIPFGEIVISALAVVWTKKAPSVWRKFPVFDQNGGSDCVANTAAKILGILRWLKDQVFVRFSSAHIYRRRSNYPGGGMIGNNAFEILAQGATLDAIVPSDGLHEAELNSIQIPAYGVEVSKLFAIDNAVPILPPIGDIETAASVIQATGKPLMVWFFFTAEEWGASTVDGAPSDYNRPKVISALTGPQDRLSLNHSVTAVDFTLTADGKKALIIEDSAHFGGYVRRIIDEDFYKARNWYVAYPMSLKTVQVTPETHNDTTRPRYTFTKPLRFIPWDNSTNKPSNPALHASQEADVRALQDILKYEGNMAANVASTGYYGPLTCTAVMKGQIAHNVDALQTLQDLKGEVFGAKSIAAYNAVYGL